MSNTFECIYSYTRKQAIDDGVLIDVSNLASEVGIRFPVAVTSALYSGHITPSEDLEQCGQSVSGRLWDVLIMLRFLAANSNEATLRFDVFFLMEPGSEPEPVKIKAMCHPGDNREPVITIMYPEED
jgi:hypothetical protein